MKAFPRNAKKLYLSLELIFSYFQEFVHGHNRYKLGKICKNLFDMARIDYIKNNIKLPVKYCMKTKLFNYIETDVTLENTMIYVKLEKIKENFLNK